MIRATSRLGTPRLVPITFAVVDGLICSAVDGVKPKTSLRLARLDDVRRDPRVDGPLLIVTPGAGPGGQPDRCTGWSAG